MNAIPKQRLCKSEIEFLGSKLTVFYWLCTEDGIVLDSVIINGNPASLFDSCILQMSRRNVLTELISAVDQDIQRGTSQELAA